MKRILSAIRGMAPILCMMMTAIMLTACGDQIDETPKAAETGELKTTAEMSEEAEGDLAKGSYTIGISQFAQHGSLDNCREGFIEGLRQAGIVEGENLTIDYQNAEADTGLANQIAGNFVASKVDLICAIATPSAQSAYNAALDTGVPTIFTAVTDPVAAELASEDRMPVGNVTGTSDKLPVEAQLAMIRELLPDAKTIGIIYTTSEVNSETTIAEYEAIVGEYGFELETVGISSIADVPVAADTLLAKVDCLNNLTDNTVVSALPTIIEKANEKGISVFGSEVEQVKIGCLASEGIEYYQLGIQTGLMAAKVLKGEAEASQMPYEIIEESSLYINGAVAEKLGIEISDEVSGRAAEFFTEIE